MDAKVCLPVLTVGYQGYDSVENYGDVCRALDTVPAPPAIVPSRYLLISITFLTVPDAVLGEMKFRLQ